MGTLISIIMPYKNCATFLTETIHSILGQTHTNWELIAINDHSEDNGMTIVKNFEEKDSRITTVNNNGHGIIPALKTGYALATGTYITRMDADDICTPQKLEELKNTIDLHGEYTIAIGKVSYFKSDGSPIGDGYSKYENWINRLAKEQKSFSEIYKECPIPSPSWMLLKTTFDQIGAFNSSFYPEDYELAFRMYKARLTPIGTSEKVHYWRDYSSRTSRTHENYKDNRFLELKVHYFLNLDYENNKTLVLFGAGKKGKMIAQLLIQHEIEFEWICSTPNKIGHNIYGKILQDSETTFSNSQIIVAIAAAKDLSQIKLNEIDSNDYYYFC